MKRKRAILFFVLIILAGCTAKIGSPIRADYIEFIRPGFTFEDKIREKLGKPYRESCFDAKKVISYKYIKGGYIGKKVNQQLIITINEEGKVTNFCHNLR